MPAVGVTGATAGSHDRIDCLIASRTIVAQRWRPFSAFGPSQRETERAAAHGTIASTPSSVAACTASSSRSPFASACTSVIRGAGGSSMTTVVGLERELARAGRRHHAVHDDAAAVADRDPLAGAHPGDGDGVPRLVARELHDGARRDGRPGRATRRGRGGSSRHPSAEEPVAQAGEEALLEVR